MANSNQAFIKHSFLCGLHGFHVYKEIWKPITGELLRCSHEWNNIYDRYAIAANKQLRGRLADSIIGHLPREISRATCFFLLRGAMVHLKSNWWKLSSIPIDSGRSGNSCWGDMWNGWYTKEQGNNGKIQDTRNYTLQGASQDSMVNLTTVQRMYWRNCAKVISQMPKKNLRRILTLINI